MLCVLPEGVEGGGFGLCVGLAAASLEWAGSGAGDEVVDFGAGGGGIDPFGGPYCRIGRAGG